MKVFAIVGHSGMGKTTLLEKLIPELRDRGIKVSLIKHSHKQIDIDMPGKDSFRLREAGCLEVLVIGKGRWALMHELRDQDEPSLEFLLGRMHACDLVLIEGFKTGEFPKLEVWRESLGRPTLWPGLSCVKAIANDACNSFDGVASIDLHDLSCIADFVLSNAEEFSPFLTKVPLLA
jgi:molybdopterin-guanine dinucleotide biosynthesis protein B